MPPPFVASPQVDGNGGPILFGVHVSMVLIGVLFNQTASYWSRFGHKREPYAKLLVAALVTIMLAKLLTDMLGIYYVFIYNFGNFASLEHFPLMFKIGTVLAVFPALLCQSWLLWRVFVVSERNVWVLAVLSPPVAATAVLDIWSTYIRIKHGNKESTPKDLRVYYPIWVYTICATNLALTSAFVFIVSRFAPRTVHPRLAELFRRLVTVAIQSCLPNTIATVVVAILVAASPNTSAYLTFQFFLAPLYSCSVLFTLNSRESEEERLSCHDLARDPSFLVGTTIASVPTTTCVLRDVGGMLWDGEAAKGEIGTVSEEAWMRGRSQDEGKV